MAPLDYKSSLVRYRRYLQSTQKHPLWKASLFLILSLILVIVLIALALRPTLITIASLAGEIQQQRQVQEKLNQKISAISRAQQELAQISSRIVILDEALPIDVKIGLWNRTLNEIASQSGISITEISLDDITISTGSADLSEIIFNIRANGNFDSIRQFLLVFEGTRRLIIIENVSISRSDFSSDQLELIVSGILGNFK